MKQKKSLFDEINKIFKIVIGKKINLKSKIYDYKQWDSLANFNILLMCEKKFKIKFNTEEFSKINSVKEIYSIVKNKINK